MLISRRRFIATLHSTAFSFLLFSNASESAEKIIGFLEVTPERGEGIFQLLRRFGLKANSEAYRSFTSLNAVRLTDGDALFPGQTYTLPVIDISFDEPFDSVLTKLGVIEFRDEIVRYNKIYNKEFRLENGAVPDGLRLLIPEPGCGYYSVEKAPEVSSPAEVQQEETGEYTVPYPELKKRFKRGSKSKKLSKYCFILDPGHGGDDPGTNPVVERGDGQEAHTFEAPLVYDTTLRLMKQIVENDGEAFLTHYSTSYGIRDIKNPQDYAQHKYNLSSHDIRTDTPAQSLNERKFITAAVKKNNYNKGRKIIFISVHADYLPDKTRDLPITFFYNRFTQLDGGKSRRFANELSKAVTGTTTNSKAKGLGVLYKNPADLEVLVELANLNNKNGAWRLRYHTYREKLAGILCDAFIKTLPGMK